MRGEPGGRLRLLGPRAPAPLSRARKVASWQARLLSLTTTRIRAASAVQAVQYLYLSKKRTKWQRRQRQGRGARFAPARCEKCGQKPTPRWAFPHARPHESIVSVFCPHERTVRESSILRRCRTLSNPSLFLGHSIPRIQASFSALPALCRVLFNNHLISGQMAL